MYIESSERGLTTMKVKDLATIFFGTVSIQRSHVLPHHRYSFDSLYEGALMHLEDEEILNSPINVMSNMSDKGKAILVITVY